MTIGDLDPASGSLTRLREVAAALVRHGVGRGVREVEVPVGGDGSATPQRVAAALVELGPTAVKPCPVLSTRPDVLRTDCGTCFSTMLFAQLTVSGPQPLPTPTLWPLGPSR